jgi:hypothetical protein
MAFDRSAHSTSRPTASALSLKFVLLFGLYQGTTSQLRKYSTQGALYQGTTSQLAEILNPGGFVTGHDFSRADKASRMIRASAPAEFILC